MKTLNKVILILITLIALGAMPFDRPSYAIPTLQLDIGGGYYDYGTETIVATGNSFTLYAFLTGKKGEVAFDDTFYISAGVVPQVGPSNVDLGSFSFNGATTDVTDDMVYGVPPIEQVFSLQGWDSGDLSKHSIYPSYFQEFAFEFDNSHVTNPYNTQDRAKSGAPISLSAAAANACSVMYYKAFTVDISNLDPRYIIHFDLYNTKFLSYRSKKISYTDVDVNLFAPFSHDAESSPAREPVPEPATFILVGGGLIALRLLKRRSDRK